MHNNLIVSYFFSQENPEMFSRGVIPGFCYLSDSSGGYLS